MTVQAIPEGFHSITPHLVVHDSGAAIDFYKRAFNATEISRLHGPDGKSIMHAQIRIGDTFVMMSDECREWGSFAPTGLGGTPLALHLYVEDADAAFAQAVQAGATVLMPVQEMFWGDRYGKITDPFGHQWSLATHLKDVSPAQLQEAMKNACASQPTA